MVQLGDSGSRVPGPLCPSVQYSCPRLLTLLPTARTTLRTRARRRVTSTANRAARMTARTTARQTARKAATPRASHSEGSRAGSRARVRAGRRATQTPGLRASLAENWRLGQTPQTAATQTTGPRLRWTDYTRALQATPIRVIGHLRAQTRISCRFFPGSEASPERRFCHSSLSRPTAPVRQNALRHSTSPRILSRIPGLRPKRPVRGPSARTSALALRT